jgi:hypothetical protein
MEIANRLMATWSDDKRELYETLLWFHDNYQCPKCALKAAFYLEDCNEDLHILHDNLYRIEQEVLK